MLPAASADASSGSSAQTASAEAAASGDETPAEQDFFAMDTYMAVSAYGQNKEEAVAMAKKEIDRLDALLSSENEDSEVAELNRNGGGKVSQDVAALLNSSLQLFAKRTGRLISLYSRSWNYGDFRRATSAFPAAMS
jgi:thiamine biosynthesis lipoprotein